MTKAQKALMHDVMDKIDSIPDRYDATDEQESWDQTVYFSNLHKCNTAGCFAGWSILLTHTLEECNDIYQGWGEVEIAQNILGLTYHQSDKLFYQGNTRERLHELVKEYTA